MAADGQERLTGIVLAAGAGRRMGGPKGLLVAFGEPLALGHARRLREAGCAEVVLVTRPELAAAFPGERVALSEAPDPAGSLSIGLAALAPEGDDVVVVTPVDACPAQVATIRALVAAVRQGALAATPTCDGRGGHPVVARGEALLPLVSAPVPLRAHLAALGDARVRVEVPDPAIALDLDTPDDVLRATGSPPSFLAAPHLPPRRKEPEEG